MVVTSIKPIADVIAWPIRWIPTHRDARQLRGDSRRCALPALALQQRRGVDRGHRDQPGAGRAGGLRPDAPGGARRATDADRHSRRRSSFRRWSSSCPSTSSCRRSGCSTRSPGLVFAYLSVTLPICTWMVATSLRDIPVGDRGGRPHRRLQRLPHPARHHPADRHARHRHRGHLRLRAVVAGVHLRPALHDDRARPDRAGAAVLPAGPAPDRLRAADGRGGAALDPHRRALRDHPALLPQRDDRRRHSRADRHDHPRLHPRAAGMRWTAA